MTDDKATESAQENTQDDKALWRAFYHIIALNRSAEFLDDLPKLDKELNGNHAPSQEEALEKLIYDIHTRLYRDTHSLAHNSETAAGNAKSPAESEKLRKIIHEMSGELFDANAAAVFHSRDELAEIYTKYYRELSELKPFSYGNGLTISTFITAVSNIKKSRETEGVSIDFRRLDEGYLKLFNDDGTPCETTSDQSLKDAFLQALNPQAVIEVHNKRAKAKMLTLPGDNTPHPNQLKEGEKQNTKIFPGWEDNRIEIGGVPFLGYKAEDGEVYLLTVTGGLVPYEEAKDKIETAKNAAKQSGEGGVLVDEYPTFNPQTYIKNISEDGIEFKKPETGKTEIIDGYVCKAGKEPLICMDVNVLTGLRAESHAKFMAAFKNTYPDKEIFWLADNNNAKPFLEDVDKNNDPRLSKICRIAVSHIQHMTHKLDAEMNKEVEHIPNANQGEKLLVFSMGGSGSGKSCVGDYIAKKTGSTKEQRNYVYTSLDQYREKMQMYQVMISAGHHADDYKLVEPFAGKLRDWVAEKAIKIGKSIQFDGSAIPFKGRYDWLVNMAKNAGYQVDVVAADTYMDVPEEARAANLGVSAKDRVIGRKEKDKRALPWAVTLSKHTNAINAFLDAAQDTKIDNVLLYNMDGPPGTSYLAAYAFNANDDEMKVIIDRKPEQYMKLLKNHKIDDETLSNMPDLLQHNIGYTQHRSNKKDRMMMVTDLHKLIQMGEKGLQNSYAADLDSLHARTSNNAAVLPSPQIYGLERIVGNAAMGISRAWNSVKAIADRGYSIALNEQVERTRKDEGRAA